MPKTNQYPANMSASSSIYVGDLSLDVREAILFQKFSTVGPVHSIRVCRDVSGRSLGYAYVNFFKPEDAERALDDLNSCLINGKPCRLMWSQRDPSLRKSGVGNIFIKGLEKSIDSQALYDTFSCLGKVLSCKVVCDANNQSKGFGYVHFESEDAASNAINRLNGKLLNGKKVFTGKFIPQTQRQKQLEERFQKLEGVNLYVKNLDAVIDDERLKKLFAPFGEITSAKVSDTNKYKKACKFYVKRATAIPAVVIICSRHFRLAFIYKFAEYRIPPNFHGWNISSSPK